MQANDIVALATELQRQKETKRDFIVPSGQIKAENVTMEEGSSKIMLHIPSPEVPEHDLSYEITEHCHDQIAGKTRIPTRFYRRLQESHPELLVKNINTLIQEKDKRLVRTLDGKARALLSDRYRIIDNYDVLFNAMDVFKQMNDGEQKGIFIKRADLTDTRLYIKALSNSLVDEVFGHREGERRVGDAVQGGIIISNSEVGNGAYKVMPFMNVLKCQNGLISEESFAKVHLGRTKEVGEIDWSDDTLRLDDEALWSKISDLIRGTFNPEIFSKWVDRINGVAETVIEKPTVAINNVVKRYGLPPSRTDELLSAFAQEGYTQWGLSNAVTWVAHEVSDYETQVEMEKAGVKILEEKNVEVFTEA